MLRHLASLVAAALVAAAAPAVAQEGGAGRRVLIVPLEGRGHAAVERALVEQLGAVGHDARLLEGTAPEDPDSDAGAAALAEAQAVDAVLGGRTRGRGTTPTLALWVRGANGAEVERFTLRIRGRRGLATLRGRLEAVLERVPRQPVPPPAAAVVPEVEEPSMEPPPAPPEATEEPDEEPSPPEADAAPWLELEARLGGGIGNREVDLGAEDGTFVLYDSGVFPEIAAEVEARLFNLAFARLAFASSVGLESQTPNGETSGSHFFRFEGTVGLRGRWDEVVDLGLGLGVLVDHYQIRFNEQLPTASYPSLRPAAWLGFLIVPRRLEIHSTFGLRFPLGIGDLGSLYGVDNSAIGWDVGGRVQGAFDFGLTWALDVTYRRYDLSFDLAGPILDGPDRGVSATALVGYRFGLR